MYVCMKVGMLDSKLSACVKNCIDLNVVCCFGNSSPSMQYKVYIYKID